MIYDADTLKPEEFDNIPIFANRGPLFELCMREVLPEGHLVELGVYVGHSVNYLADLVPQRIFHGFDSFEGLPEAWVRTAGREVLNKGHFRMGKLPQVKSNVVLHKGWFSDTIPEWLVNNPGNVAFLHNDSDLYSSTIFALRALDSRLVSGSIILFDELIDWYPPDSQGRARYGNWPDHEWKALKEWMGDCNRRVSLMGRTPFEQAVIRVET